VISLVIGIIFLMFALALIPAGFWEVIKWIAAAFLFLLFVYVGFWLIVIGLLTLL
jgi:hypothetical protein